MDFIQIVTGLGLDQGLTLAVVTLLFAISEVLAYVKSVNASGVFQFIHDLLKKLVAKKG